MSNETTSAAPALSAENERKPDALPTSNTRLPHRSTSPMYSLNFPRKSHGASAVAGTPSMT